LNDNVGAAVFFLLFRGYHRGMKITKNNPTFSPSLAPSELMIERFS
jgi:hypothetical protein